MAKQTKSIAPARPDASITVDKVIVDLLSEGKVSQVLTWNPDLLERDLKVVEICTESERGKLYRVVGKDLQGHGYLPKGYPSAFASVGKMVRLTLEPYNAEPVSESEQTNATQAD